MKKLCSTIVALTIASSAHAGFHGLTHHSRANCVSFNESVSWHANNYYWFWVNSVHWKDGKQQHQLIVDWAYTWRAASYHTKEGYGGWTVEGHHWMKDSQAGWPVEVATETVTDCSIYDGWWG
jgi:hypothetical protein